VGAARWLSELTQVDAAEYVLKLTQVDAAYDDLRQAAEVIAGKLEMNELTGGRSRADLVRAAPFG